MVVRWSRVACRTSRFVEMSSAVRPRVFQPYLGPASRAGFIPGPKGGSSHRVGTPDSGDGERAEEDGVVPGVPRTRCFIGIDGQK